VAFRSTQRIQKLAPSAIERPPIVLVSSVRLAAALPSRAPVEPLVCGAVKSSASTSVQVPVVNDVASKLIWKSMRSGRPAVPRRHCSPV
jgi:hypothetical protein